MIKYLNLLIVVSLLATACSKEKETPSGMKYTVRKAGSSKDLAKTEQVVIYDFVVKDSKDSVWVNTYKDGISAAAQIGDSTRIKSENGLTQLFRQVHPGDSIDISMPISKFFKTGLNAPMPPSLDSTLKLSYTMTIRDFATVQQYYDKRQQQATARDNRQIAEYLKEKNLTAESDTSGLQFIIHSTNGGQKPTVDNCVEVSYSGRLLKNGQEFDKAAAVGFPLGMVIEGWKIGISKLGVGDSATLLIPSRLAYGPRGNGPIPPDSPLIFNVKLLAVKKDFDQQNRACK
jgi:FKBP-type peptidyl-prolyl cis-trans isomerase FkpA